MSSDDPAAIATLLDGRPLTIEHLLENLSKALQFGPVHPLKRGAVIEKLSNIVIHGPVNTTGQSRSVSVSVDVELEGGGSSVVVKLYIKRIGAVQGEMAKAIGDEALPAVKRDMLSCLNEVHK